MDRSDPEPSRTIIGGFQILSVLGRGGMGIVYRAHDPESGRDVALKLVSGAEDDSRLERFRREGQITASLSHPGILAVHAAGEEEGRPFLAYELLEDCADLTQAMAERGLRDRIVLIRDAARALGHAHERGIVHRDVKPENILVDAEGRVRVADFGLAMAAGLERLTQSGGWVGTPSYMSPEQLQGKTDAIRPTADVWALGVILYQALTGSLPYVAATFFELIAQIHRGSPRTPRSLNRRLPVELEAICLQAMSVDPSARYLDADRFAGELEAWLEGRPVAARASPSWLTGRARRHAVWILPLVALAGLPWVLLAPRAKPAVSPRDLRNGADILPPQVELISPEADAQLGEERVLLRGRVMDDGPWVEVVVGDEELLVPRGGEFRFEVPLRVGANALTVLVRDAAGNERRIERRVTRHATPAWWQRLAPSGRHRVPLPEGVVFGESPGEYVNEKDGSILVWTPPGSFRMGSPNPFTGRDSDQQPVHTVRISRGFFLGKYELSFAHYWAYCTATGRPRPKHELLADFTPTGRHPVFQVNWEDARDYCAWAGLRLPTEAEWEYAARGGDEERTYPWGFEEPTLGQANWGRPGDMHPRLAPVGSYPAGVSRWGCYDMAGNLTEWVATRYRPYPANDQVDPGLGEADDDPHAERVGRGAAWGTVVAERFTPTYRFSKSREERELQWGFRVCRDPR